MIKQVLGFLVLVGFSVGTNALSREVCETQLSQFQEAHYKVGFSWGYARETERIAQTSTDPMLRVFLFEMNNELKAKTIRNKAQLVSELQRYKSQCVPSALDNSSVCSGVLSRGLLSFELAGSARGQAGAIAEAVRVYGRVGVSQSLVNLADTYVLRSSNYQTEATSLSNLIKTSCIRR